MQAPWAEVHHQIGFVDNRDLVGGRIFNNAFHAKLVVAFEQAVVSDGHEFTRDSVTARTMPVRLWDALDVIVLTGVTPKTMIGRLAETPCQIAILDCVMEGLPHPACRACPIDFEPAFRAMFHSHSPGRHRNLHLVAAIRSGEKAARLAAFTRACADCPSP